MRRTKIAKTDKRIRTAMLERAKATATNDSRAYRAVMLSSLAEWLVRCGDAIRAEQFRLLGFAAMFGEVSDVEAKSTRD